MQSSSIHGKIGNRDVSQRADEGAGIAALLRDCAGRNCRVFLFGGDSRTIDALREQVASVFPTIRIAGICDSDFADPIDRAVLDHIAAAGAEVIVSDLPEARFRLFCAQCAAMGIYGQRINLPGSFANFAFGAGLGPPGFSVPARLSRIGATARALLRFACLVLSQRLRRPKSGCALPVPPRPGGGG